MLRLTHEDVMDLVEQIRKCEKESDAAVILFNSIYQDELKDDTKQAKYWEDRIF